MASRSQPECAPKSATSGAEPSAPTGGDSLLLKWGTLKGWDLESEAARAAMKVLAEAGARSMSAAMQHDTDAQKEALCGLIDAIDGEITNDWSGEQMTKDEAKKYVREYRR